MLENIIVTSGGTKEPIDRIRSITNTSTGMLGSLIALALAEKESVGKILYVHGSGAVMPQHEKITAVPAFSTQALLDTATELCGKYKIDAVVHCMAVSDFRVRSVISTDILENAVRNGGFDINSLFENEDLLKKYNKLPSSAGDPVLLMEKTPKIMPVFRKLLPDAEIVGFKLLDGVSHEELVDTAFSLLEKNGCDYVLANDYTTVEKGMHEGFLIDRNKKELRFCGKKAIADGIAAALTGDDNK